MRAAILMLMVAMVGMMLAGCEKTIKEVRANPADDVALSK